MFSYCSAVSSLQQDQGPSSQPSRGALYPSSTQQVPLLPHRTSTAEVLTQISSCHQNGGECTTETPRPSLKRASRELLANPKPSFTCGWELCLQAGKDGDPPPLHLAPPGCAGDGRPRERRRRRKRKRRGSSTGCAGVWPPQEEAQLL